MLARDWFAALSAPSKHIIELDHSGHDPQLEEPGRFATFLTDVVRNQTYPATS